MEWINSYLNKLGFCGNSILKREPVCKKRRNKLTSKRWESKVQLHWKCKAKKTSASKRALWRRNHFACVFFMIWFHDTLLLFMFYATNGLLLISLLWLMVLLWIIIWERRFVLSVHCFSRVITYFVFVIWSVVTFCLNK